MVSGIPNYHDHVLIKIFSFIAAMIIITHPMDLIVNGNDTAIIIQHHSTGGISEGVHLSVAKERFKSHGDSRQD